MKYNFTLPDFPNSVFELKSSIWTGKLRLTMNSAEVEQSKEIGKPFLIPTSDGNFIKAFPKQSFPELAPILEINNKRNRIVEKLEWYQYTIGALPILLLFMGGAFGGAVGVICTAINFNIFRQERSGVSKYANVIGVIVLSFLFYYALATILLKVVE